MYLAVVTPLDVRSTGVADYSLDLLPHLARTAGHRIIVFGQDLDKHQKLSTDGWTWQPITELGRTEPGVDLIIYQMGNSPAHDFMAPFLLKYPGLVVLHDLSLHNFYVRQATQANQPGTYKRAFAFGYGLRGLWMARRHLQEGVPVNYPDYLLSEWIATRSPGVIVHSRHAATLLKKQSPQARIWTVPMPMPITEHISLEKARAHLGLAPDIYLVVVFGVINRSKNPMATLDAIRQLRADGIPAQVAFIGHENTEFQLAPEVERRELQDSVIQLGFVADLTTVNLWLSAADVAVSLRSPYWGETPSSALRILASGLPLITHDVGAFTELPNTACIKIASDIPDPSEVLYRALLNLYQEPDHRHNMSAAAREYIAQKHTPDVVAARYIAVIREILHPPIFQGPEVEIGSIL
jgi:glycosyltransferase involved in cell wall biosynthesis